MTAPAGKVRCIPGEMPTRCSLGAVCAEFSGGQAGITVCEIVTPA